MKSGALSPVFSEISDSSRTIKFFYDKSNKIFVKLKTTIKINTTIILEKG